MRSIPFRAPGGRLSVVGDCSGHSPSEDQGDDLAEFRDGLTTTMRYAVYALGREYGPDDGADHGADQDFYRILRKPPYEAFKAYQVMRHEWGLDVIAVCPDRATILRRPVLPLPARRAASGRLRRLLPAQPSSPARWRARCRRRARPCSGACSGRSSTASTLRSATSIGRRASASSMAASSPIGMSPRRASRAPNLLHHACYIHGLRATKIRTD